MIHLAKERLTPLLVGEMLPILDAHYEELTLHKERVKLKPRWIVYYTLQARGHFVIYTARDDSGRLVGYNAFFIDAHMHYEDLIVATNDVFFIVPEHRRGSTALRFLRFTEQQLREGGVDKVAYHHKAANNFGPILHRLGYSPEEGVAAKLL